MKKCSRVSDYTHLWNVNCMQIQNVWQRVPQNNHIRRTQCHVGAYIFLDFQTIRFKVRDQILVDRTLIFRKTLTQKYIYVCVSEL